MKLGDRVIGGDAPLFLIAEAGVNHNGRPELAHRLIDVAVEAGADAVKFQTFEPSLVVAASGASTDYQIARTGTSNQRDLLNGLTLPERSWEELAAHASERGIVFLSTPFDEPSLEFVVSLGVEAVKVPSGEVTNLPFLRTVGATGLPVLLSTGMATFGEVDAAVDALTARIDFCILHCVTAYPAPAGESNLRVIPQLRYRYGVPAGWSDHTGGSLSAIAAVALGAALLEKHVTLDRSMLGPDHEASLDPDGFRRYVDEVRTAQTALGDGDKRPVDSEKPNMPLVRRSWHLTRDVLAGHQLQADDVVALRPATGIPPSVDVVGCRLRFDGKAGGPLTKAMVEPPG